MTQTTAKTDNLHTVSPAALTKALQAIDLLPKTNQWVVIDPDGNLYKGTIEQITSLVIGKHPLMQTLSRL